MLQYDLTERALRPLSVTNSLDDLLTQRLVIEHAQIHIEQRVFFRAQLRCHIVCKRLDILPHLDQALPEKLDLQLGIIAKAVGDSMQISRWAGDDTIADRDSRGAGDAMESPAAAVAST